MGTTRGTRAGRGPTTEPLGIVLALMVVLSVVVTGGIVMLSNDGYQAIDIIFAIITWAAGIGGVMLLLAVLRAFPN